MPPWFRSMYFGSRPWWTRWLEGVLSTHSSGPSLPMTRVWIQNWYSVFTDVTLRNISGGKPRTASGR